MRTDHEYHELEVVGVVDETADSRSFVLGIPPGLAPDVHVRGRAVLHVPGDDRRRAGRALVLDVELARHRRSVHHDREARCRRPHVELDDTTRSPPGATIEVMRPTGLFVLRDRDVPIVAFAGGSGITPVISIIKSALATTARPILLVYANRDADVGDLRRRARAVARASTATGSSVHHHLDSDRGFLDAAQCAALVGEHRADADFYVCGPGRLHGHRRSRVVDARRRAEPGLHRAVRRSRRRAGRRRRRRNRPNRS